MLAAAGAQTRCAGLSQNQLATMVLAPTYPETGASGSLSPSPMTLSRYDTVAVNPTNVNLYYAYTASTPYQRAFWNPGVGAWQFDSAGGWPMSTAQEMSTDTASASAAAVMASRWCNDTADAGNDAARRAKAWSPWAGCNSGVCETFYQAVYDPTTLNINTDPSVTRTGGMVARTCTVTGGVTVSCWRVDPALAQGDAAFAVPGFGPTPIADPFYDYVLNGIEYRVWLSADTGYPLDISGAVPIGANARLTVVWSGSATLCDTVSEIGTCAGPQLFLRNSNSSGVADTTTSFAAPTTGTTLMCDWDGNGTSTPGVFAGGIWYVTNAAGGAPQAVFGYGDAGDIPVCGDWDGNGTVTPGVVRNGTWYLSNTLGRPVADVTFGFGNPTGDIPVVGDWNGDGRYTPGVFRSGHWYLSNTLGRPVADVSFGYGNPTGDIPVVGDWNGDGRRHPRRGARRGLVPDQHRRASPPPTCRSCTAMPATRWSPATGPWVRAAPSAWCAAERSAVDADRGRRPPVPVPGQGRVARVAVGHDAVGQSRSRRCSTRYHTPSGPRRASRGRRRSSRPPPACHRSGCRSRSRGRRRARPRVLDRYQMPLRTTPGVSIPSPFQSPTTGMSPEALPNRRSRRRRACPCCSTGTTCRCAPPRA